MPVTVAPYQGLPEINMNADLMHTLDVTTKRAFVQSCPMNVYSYCEETQSVKIDKPLNCTFCNECVLTGESIIEKQQNDNTSEPKNVSIPLTLSKSVPKRRIEIEQPTLVTVV